MNFYVSNKIKCFLFHGDKNQLLKQKSINDFENSLVDVFVVIDLAARKICVDKGSFCV